MKLTILMPCLNESETLGSCIAKANTWAAGANIEYEVLIADNGSTDGSQKIAKSMGARVINVPERGYGAALYHGCVAAKGKYIIMGDSDDSYDFGKLDLFIKKLDEGFDLVMGNRFLGGIAPNAMPWKNRYIGNPILTWVGKVLFSCPSSDFHCGLRGFSKNAFMLMDLRTTGMEFASEMVIKASLFNMRIAEVPTILSKDGRTRPPHLRPWRDGWRHLRFMLLFSPQWLFVAPGLILFLCSAIAYGFLVLGPVHLGGINFQEHTLFYAQTGIVLGFLAIALGIIMRMFGIREGLLRENSTLERLRISPILEIGGLTGVIIILLGLYFGFATLFQWSRVGFGALTPGELLRTVSLSTTMILFGGILTMSSLIMGFLALPLKR